jgi:hypothetical protein
MAIKLTEQMLAKIIQEEVRNIVNEGFFDFMGKKKSKAGNNQADAGEKGNDYKKRNDWIINNFDPTKSHDSFVDKKNPAASAEAKREVREMKDPNAISDLIKKAKGREDIIRELASRNKNLSSGVQVSLCNNGYSAWVADNENIAIEAVIKILNSGGKNDISTLIANNISNIPEKYQIGVAQRHDLGLPLYLLARNTPHESVQILLSKINDAHIRDDLMKNKNLKIKGLKSIYR